MSPDELLEEGWVARFDSIGAVEGPRWWKASASPMGCIAPRHVEIDRAKTITEAATMLWDAIQDPERKHDLDWTEKRILHELDKAEERVAEMAQELYKKQHNIDWMGRSDERRENMEFQHRLFGISEIAREAEDNNLIPSNIAAEIITMARMDLEDEDSGA